jgi:adenine-specific DNA-methyltransferase
MRNQSLTDAILEITFEKTRGQTSSLLASVYDTILWYARDRKQVKYRQIFIEKEFGGEGTSQYIYVESPNGETNRRMTKDELENPLLIPQGWRIYSASPMVSESGSSSTTEPFEFEGKSYTPKKGGWKTNTEGFERLKGQRRILLFGNTLMFKRYYSDFPFFPVTNHWRDTFMTGFSEAKLYVVQTSIKTIQRCVLMTTDPGDIVLDPTCGSGTTAYAAEQWGRRWITCDTSRVAITLAKQRLMTSVFNYYHLAQPDEGVDSGFRYETVPHAKLENIANNEPPKPETLYDKPLKDESRSRVTGPFTVEAVPAPAVKPLVEVNSEQIADESIARSGETLRQAEWRDELYRTGIRGKGGQKIEFTRVEPLPGTRWLHADAETKEAKPQRVAVSFGPEFAPLEQRQVELALEEAQTLVPKPRLIVFASFQFDPEAAKDIDATTWPGVTLLKAQMNTDLLTEDLKKKRASNESFWLIGQPDVTLEKIKKGDDAGKYRVAVHGFDYYNTRTGSIESGGQHQIAVWLLDPDYDGRSLFPRQVFFPMSSEKDGWSKLARNLKAEIDEELIEAYRGTVSLPFEAGKYKRVAVKIVDDRGIESLKIIEIE